MICKPKRIQGSLTYIYQNSSSNHKLQHIKKAYYDKCIFVDLFAAQNTNNGREHPMINYQQIRCEKPNSLTVRSIVLDIHNFYLFIYSSHNGKHKTIHRPP